MEIWGWLANNWFELISAVGIVGGLAGLWLSIEAKKDETAARKEETAARRVGNLIALTANHRELMAPFYEKNPPDRIFDSSVDVSTAPPNFGEEVYFSVLVEHLFSVFRAMQYDLTMKPEGLERDIRNVFSLPMPKKVWEKMKPLQDRDFVQFIKNCLGSQ